MNSKRAKRLKKEAGGAGYAYEELKKQHKSRPLVNRQGVVIDPKRKLSKRQANGRSRNTFGTRSLEEWNKSVDRGRSVQKFNRKKAAQVVVPKRNL